MLHLRNNSVATAEQEKKKIVYEMMQKTKNEKKQEKTLNAFGYCYLRS